MAWSDKLKLNKQLLRSVNEAGFANPKELQLKTINRIIGGQDIIAIGPEGSGKTTTYVLGVLNRFNYAPEGVPRVLVLVPEKEQVVAVIEQFDRLNKNKSIRIVGLYVTPGFESQMDELAEGADIVVATPDRARAIYLKLALNLNKVDLLVIDDADQIIKKGLQLPVVELANSIDKGQHLVFTEVMHAKLEKMLDPFMRQPATIEVDELGEMAIETHEQLLYNVPNFGTKLNLLNLFMYDEELFTKTIVFVNTQTTAEKLFQSLKSRLRTGVAYLNPKFFDSKGFKTIEEFKAEAGARVLIVTNENDENLNLSGIPFLIHFDLPTDNELFISRVANPNPDDKEETLAMTFATDIELSQVKKIEQMIGNKIPVAELPDDLVIVTESKPKKADAKEDVKPAGVGEAFHEKKASNAKTYNLSAGTKAKMNKKKKHG
ncbi:DEAD/DEAH box helicase [Mucilaginibacter rubeus]|uniref:DEAD/DEAH box helicase n=1 Tax=Mucilaginibacter rubeus TaxID=2027860 RepID=A0AAE6JEB5_9SPHI|nr:MULTISPECIES: DEAD/DEAH box helicase [Mucilaginibacter]QEM03826.1 DEAD/DEAH box helicase [Mucilaginibacter rubeus]QEM16436.1 DEAD/DEAH box helicase [Mucilaginibacter gossypii]QTE40795.1 DEAD/DEAH box helicase [Mucilaginibacter rubeus]QTE47397.1 DEAD/DEAH box helicase [Mucilaginibacter rubeus]QTE58791.1 DEAD/DEAH box helicase [Mucilaginibacter rubeus]